MVFLAIFLLSAGIILSALFHRANHTVEQYMNTFLYYQSRFKRYSFASQSLMFYRLKKCFIIQF